MNTSRNPGRVAGILYLFLFAAPLRLVYIPNTLFVTGNASATANNIAAHQTLFRLGIVGDLFTGRRCLSSSRWLFTGCSKEWTSTWLS